MSVLNKPVKPYTFVDGAGNLAYGSEVNADFDILYNKVGDVIDVVNTTDYQTLVNTAQQAIDAEALAQDWASKSDGIVDATDYSAKAYAIGGTGVSGAAGAAKEWAIKTDAAVDGSEYSAKYYAQAAAQVYDSFDDRYLGAKAADPTLDNDGNAWVEGAIYWNTTLKNFKVWSGTAWQAWQYSIPDGDKGDITVSNSGETWTIDANAGTPAYMSSTGTAGQVLTSNGPGADPSYQPLPASYSDEQAQDAAANLFTSGAHSGISFIYDDANNRVNATVSGGGVTSINGQTGSVVTTNLYSIGSFVVGRPANSTSYTVNTTVAGSSLYATVPGVCGVGGSITGGLGAALVNVGSWRCVSPATLDGDSMYSGLWVRYA